MWSALLIASGCPPQWPHRDPFGSKSDVVSGNKAFTCPPKVVKNVESPVNRRGDRWEQIQPVKGMVAVCGIPSPASLYLLASALVLVSCFPVQSQPHLGRTSCQNTNS